MDKSIMEDQNMIPYMQEKNSRLSSYNESLSEADHIEYLILRDLKLILNKTFSFHFRKGLKEANKEYKQVAKNIAATLESFKVLYIIKPDYHVNWSLIKKLLLNDIQSMSKENSK